MTAPRCILHADMDAFYASVEQRDHPELRGKPVIVGASTSRGVVAAASYEARTFGVRSAMPGFQARKLCPHGHFLPGDMKKYVAESRRVHQIFGQFTDQIEPLALDEAFLDITGSAHLFGGAKKLAQELKARVQQRLGLTVSVGIAPNKLVAKIACTQGKPDGLLEIEEGQIASLLHALPMRALWGVGPKAEQRLSRQGFVTIGDIAQGSLSRLSAALGSQAEEIRTRARGKDERPVETSRRARSIGEEATFAQDVSDPHRISSAITSHSEAVAARARRAGLLGHLVILRVKLARRRSRSRQTVANHELFVSLTRQKQLAEPTDLGPEIRRAALELYSNLALEQPVRLLGVTLSKLSARDEPGQLALFDQGAHHLASSAKREREKKLGAALDAISDKFGSGAIARAGAGTEKITPGDRMKLGEPLPKLAGRGDGGDE